MESGLIDVLVKEVMCITKELKNNEKQLYPDLVKLKRKMMLSLMITAVLYVILVITIAIYRYLLRFGFALLVFSFLLFLSLIVAFLITVSIGKTLQNSMKEYPQIFREKRVFFLEYLYALFKSNTEKVIEMLIVDIEKIYQKRRQAYSYWIKGISSAILLIFSPTVAYLIDATVKGNAIDQNMSISLLILLFAFMILVLFINREIEMMVNRPLIGKNSRLAELQEILGDIKYSYLFNARSRDREIMTGLDVK